MYGSFLREFVVYPRERVLVSVPGEPGDDFENETGRRRRVRNGPEMPAFDAALQVLGKTFQKAATQLAEPDGGEFGPVERGPFDQGAGLTVARDEGVQLPYDPVEFGPRVGHPLPGQGRVELREPRLGGEPLAQALQRRFRRRRRCGELSRRRCSVRTDRT